MDAMSEGSDSSPQNIYEEDLNNDSTCDLSSKGLETVPKMNIKMLCVLYLQDNKITTLPEDLFPSLPNLMYLDLRNNQITDIPTTVKQHLSLTHLLMQNNKLTSLPNELGTVNLKVLQLAGNPLMFPPREIINAGVSKVLAFLHTKYLDEVLNQSQSDVSDDVSNGGNHSETMFSQEVVSYNSVIDGDKLKNNALSIKLNEKDFDDSEEEYYSKVKGKCPKLAKSRSEFMPSYCQSAKYLKDVMKAASGDEQNEKIKRSYLKDMAYKKHKELLATRDKILQERKNAELLKNWRKSYQFKKHFTNDTYRMDPNNFPFDTNPDYMTFLTREDIEKDLPDKYRRKLVRKCRPTVARKSNNDVHLALKIKKLFENLEAIDLNREDMTPRTEQTVLLGEIKKISEIKQKLMELSSTNTRSVEAD